jgi:hypothetical protein
MNAYELADVIEDWETGANYTVSIKASQMLRQQADRIADYERWEKRWSERVARAENRIAELEKFLNETCQTGTFIVWRNSQDLAKYQQQAAELWNDSCTSNRSTK